MCHTHTPCLWQGGAAENEVKMRMRGEWRWDDHEDEVKNYLTGTRRGERKKRRREHQHDTPGPERANPEKAREKKSGGSTDTEQDQRRGGKDESAWTNLTQRKPTNTSARNGTDLPGEGGTHEIGDQWGLVGETTKKKQDSVPSYLDVVRLFPAPGPWSSLAPIGIKRLSSSNELGAQHVSPHQTTKRKETTPASRVPAWFLCHDMMLFRCKIAAK